MTLVPADWANTSGWPSIARDWADTGLAGREAPPALLSIWALYNSQLLCVSYSPTVMARDGWLPRWLTRVSSKTGAPYNGLIIISIVAAAMSALSLKKLVVVDMLFDYPGTRSGIFNADRAEEIQPDLARP